GLVGGLWLAVLGVLGAASLIIAKRPDAKQMIDKVAPYQGWIGAISAIWGAYVIVSAVLHLGWIAHWPIYWATLLATGVLQLVLGLLLGVGVIKSFVKDPTASQKMDQTVAKLAPYQGRAGIAAIVVGAWMIVSGFIFHVA